MSLFLCVAFVLRLMSQPHLLLFDIAVLNVFRKQISCKKFLVYAGDFREIIILIGGSVGVNYNIIGSVEVDIVFNALAVRAVAYVVVAVRGFKELIFEVFTLDRAEN